MDKLDAAKHEPPPVPNDSQPIYELVMADIEARAHEGRKKYGTYLQANNGRDALMDAYQEALDLAMYLRQKLEEAKAPPEQKYARLAQAHLDRMKALLPRAKAEFDRLSPEEQEVWKQYFASLILPGLEPRIGRNDPCPCGSGRKYKKCHALHADDP